jgi:subtilisin family serine protease
MGGSVFAQPGRLGRTATVLAALFSLILATAWVDRAGAKSPERGRYIVVFEDSVEHPAQLAREQAAANGGKLGFTYTLVLKGYSAALPDAAVEGLRHSPQVRAVVPDDLVEAAAQTTPTGVNRVFAPGNPNLDIDSQNDAPTNVDVAVIDSGVDSTHPDLEVVARTDCSNGNEFEATCVDGTGTDTNNNGHGTHVAGTIAALDNGQGVVGTAPGARIWSVKALGTGPDHFSEIIEAVEWVTLRAKTIEVVNMSLGCATESLPCSWFALTNAIKASVAQGIVYVGAAGNNDRNTDESIFGGNPDMILVSAVADYDGQPGGLGAVPNSCQKGPDDHLASFSNWGTSVDIAAPGACIYSTLPMSGQQEVEYGVKSGTSMAAPLVSGAAAVLAADDNPETKADVEAIRATLVAEGNYNWTDDSGDGTKEPLLDMSDSGVFNVVDTPRWRIQTTNPDPPGENHDWLEDVSCMSPSDCFAVGYSGTQPMIKRWNGLAWSLQTVKAATNAVETRLEGVDCPAANYCVAVGTYREASEEWHTLAMTWSGGSWSVQSTPTPTTESGIDRAYLREVSCTSASFCVAVGAHHFQISPGSEWQRTLALHWDGTAWTMRTAPQEDAPPSPSATYNDLQSVSCDAANSCMAVGFYNDIAAGKYRMLATRWTGSDWENLIPANSPLMGSMAFSQFYGVSCTSSTACTAVGMQRDSAGTWNTLAARWNGAWTIQSVPRPGYAGQVQLREVSCPTATSCTATGSRSSNPSRPLAVGWDGSSWQLQTTPAPTEELNSSLELNGVSCVHPRSCVTVGFFKTPSTTLSSLGLEFQNGPPSVTAVEAVGVNNGKATLRAKVDPNGWATQYQWEWGPTPAYGNSIPATPKAIGDGTAFVQVEDQIAGLSGEKTYYYRLVAQNSEATSAATGTFATGNWKPIVTTMPAAPVSDTTATLNGTVNPHGFATTYYFQYGTSTSYGSVAPITPASAGSGTTALSVSAPISGLKPMTTYQYRIVAQSSQGTSLGANQTFKTTPTAFRTEEAPVALGASAKTTQTFSGAAVSVTCTGISWTGEMTAVTTKELKATPSYAGCTGKAGSFTGAGAVNMGSCAFLYHVNGTLTLSGASCATNPMTVSVAPSPGFECKLTIPPQAVGLVSYLWTGTGTGRTVLAGHNVTGLKGTASGVLCSQQGGFTNGTYTGEVIVKASKSGISRGIWVE